MWRLSQFLVGPKALSPQDKEQIQQNWQGQREPRHDIPPAISDEGRKKADDAQRSDDDRGSKNLS